MFRKLKWYWYRFRCMSLAEIAHRFWTAINTLLERFRLASGISIPKADISIASTQWLAGDREMDAEPYCQAAETVLSGHISIFRLSDADLGSVPKWNIDPLTGCQAPLHFGKTLDYRNEKLVGNIKYLWEPNRHLQLVTLAQAYHLTGQQRYLDGVESQVRSWIDQCPYMKGPNWTSSLELAIRLINWSITWQLIGGIDSPLFADEKGRNFRDSWLVSIYQHAEFVQGYFSRHSSANNHLIGEAAGLFVAAVTWPYWPKMTVWRRKAKAVLEEEVSKQTAPDGVNREQAISYQQFVLDFLLIAVLAGKGCGVQFLETYWQRIEVMLEFLASIMDIGGNVPMIGDADDGYVVRLSQETDFCVYRSLLMTGGILLDRPDFQKKAGKVDDKTRWLLGNSAVSNAVIPESNDIILPVRKEFPHGGYYILGSDFEMNEEVRIIADAGPLGYLSIAAHGHADALSFTMSVSGLEFLIDPGTYSYHTQKKWRDYFRGTSAHNTLRVDKLDQSEIGGNFMWLKKADAKCEKWQPGKEQDKWQASHDGYKRLSDPVIHRRRLCLDKLQRQLTVMDLLICRKKHLAERFWHFSEKCQVTLKGKSVRVDQNGTSIHLKVLDKGADLQLIRGCAQTPAGWVSRQFDVMKPTTTLRVSNTVESGDELKTVIEY